MQALVIGFEPFGGDPINPATEALPQLPPRLGALAVATAIVPTVFGRSLDILDAAVAEHDPDIVLGVGLAGGRAALSLERVALNLDDARIPDMFHGVMHLAATRRPAMRGGFLHVPYLPSQASRQDGAPSMALDDIVRGILIVLETAAVRCDDIVVAEGAIS